MEEGEGREGLWLLGRVLQLQWGDGGGLPKVRTERARGAETGSSSEAVFTERAFGQARKRNPNPNFLIRIFSGGVGVFRVNGWGPKSSIRPSKPGKSNFLGRISRDFAGISRNRPKSLRKNICVQFPFPIWRTIVFSGRVHSVLCCEFAENGGRPFSYFCTTACLNDLVYFLSSLRAQTAKTLICTKSGVSADSR